MPVGLLIFYRLLGTALLVLAAATLWEKYRTVRGAQLLPGRILQCRKAGSTSPRNGAGGYRYLVELYADGERLERWGDYILIRPDPHGILSRPQGNPLLQRKCRLPDFRAQK